MQSRQRPGCLQSRKNLPNADKQPKHHLPLNFLPLSLVTSRTNKSALAWNSKISRESTKLAETMDRVNVGSIQVNLTFCWQKPYYLHLHMRRLNFQNTFAACSRRDSAESVGNCLPNLLFRFVCSSVSWRETAKSTTSTVWITQRQSRISNSCARTRTLRNSKRQVKVIWLTVYD